MYKHYRSAVTMIEVLLVLAVLAFLLAFLVSASQKIRAAAARTQSLNNIKQMALASHGFHDVYQHMPPTLRYVLIEKASKDGRGTEVTNIADLPFWASVMPFIESDPTYRSMSVKNETWGDPRNGGVKVLSHTAVWNNRALSRPIPIYYNPCDPTSSPDGLANGMGIVGYGVNVTALPEVSEFNLNDARTVTGRKRTLGAGFPDGTSNTIIVAERYVKTYFDWQSFEEGGPARVNYWHDPYLTRFDMNSKIQGTPSMKVEDKNRAAGQQVQGPRREGILVGLADGSGRIVRNNIDPVTWSNACDPAEGEVLGPDW